MDSHGRKAVAATLSVASNTALVIFKIVVGLVTGSVSVMSEAIHSGMDLVAACIALVAVRASGKPADDDHPYGHGKFENLSGAIEALLIFTAAGWIIYEAIHKLLAPSPIETMGLGVAVMFVSAAVNVVVSRILFKVGRETDSVALLADAWHLRTDVYTSAGVMAGLGLIMVGGVVLPGVSLLWLDPVVAIAVAMLIMHAAFRLTRQSVRDLLDASMPGEEREWIRAYLGSLASRIRGFHRLRTRKAGPTRFVEFHLLVAADMHVDESHGITDEITAHIVDRFPGALVTIHIEPCDGTCKPVCVDGCFLDEDGRRAVRAS
ncbi:MAG: cation diffusion facilitator family transporter [Deltaproteobacteria bacterium]|nr:cation diffusion facilitator family transporter [Deltaproteobacteria bacterium]